MTGSRKWEDDRMKFDMGHDAQKMLFYIHKHSEFHSQIFGAAITPEGTPSMEVEKLNTNRVSRLLYKMKPPLAVDTFQLQSKLSNTGGRILQTTSPSPASGAVTNRLNSSENPAQKNLKKLLWIELVPSFLWQYKQTFNQNKHYKIKPQHHELINSKYNKKWKSTPLQNGNRTLSISLVNPILLCNTTTKIFNTLQ